jgi:PAS domain-containing protein
MHFAKPTAPARRASAARVVGVWNWDIQHNLVYCGTEFADYFAVDAARASRGAPIEEFLAAIHPDDLPRVSTAIRDAIAGSAGFSEVYRLATRSRGQRTILATGMAHRDAAGKPAFFTGLATDIAGSDARLPVDLLAEISLLSDRVTALKSRLVSYLFQALQDEIERLNEKNGE